MSDHRIDGKKEIYLLWSDDVYLNTMTRIRLLVSDHMHNTCAFTTLPDHLQNGPLPKVSAKSIVTVAMVRIYIWAALFGGFNDIFETRELHWVRMCSRSVGERYHK